MPRPIWLGLVLLGVLASVAPSHAASGWVFEDLDGDGRRGATEPGVPGVVVSRGARVVRTDAAGRYVLPDDEDAAAAFVVLTRPDGYDCARWYRSAAGDFALRRRPADGSSFVFVHLSDAHLSNWPSDLARYGVPESIAAAPPWLAGRMLLLMLRFQNPEHSSSAVAESIRGALPPGIDPAGKSDARVVGEWVRAVASLDEADPLLTLDPVADFDASLAELRAVAPRFVVSTGDFVLESNEADAPSVERWMRFYRERTRASGLEFYDTIGNNEIAGTANDDFGAGAPGYGKATFRRIYGPTYYSFDRGPLHFIALDTHATRPGEPEEWSWKSLDPEIRGWLAADLALHAGRPIVVLNHEPLAADRDWPLTMRWAGPVDREVAKQVEDAGVGWTLAGHVHINGERRKRGTQHIVTGALSGARWTLPPDAFPRGYRLVQLHEGELYSVWKPTGAPQVTFVEPASDPGAHATGPRRPADSPRDRVVVAAVGREGPFEEMVVKLDGQPLPLERWSAYFAAARVDPAALAPGVHTLVLEAIRADGETVRAEAQIEGAKR